MADNRRRAQFTPFSYQELVEPIRYAEAQHQAVENAYGEMAGKAALWENLASSEKDTKAYQMYKGYSEQLKGAADTLAKQGINASNRKSLLDMKTAYNQNIIPIEMAFDRKAKAVAVEQDMLAKDPSRIFKGKRASDTSLDNFLSNPNLVFDSLSGNLLTEEIGKLVSPLAKEGRGGIKIGNRLIGFTHSATSQTGYTKDEIAQQKALYLSGAEGRAQMDPVLRESLDNVLTKYGVNSGNYGEEGTAKLLSAALNGLNFAIGTTSNTTIKDDIAAMNYQAALARQKEREEKSDSELPAPSAFQSVGSLTSGIAVDKQVQSDLKVAKILLSNPDILDPSKNTEDRKFILPTRKELLDAEVQKLVRKGMSLRAAKETIYLGGSTGGFNQEDLKREEEFNEEGLILLNKRDKQTHNAAVKRLEQLRNMYGGETIEEVYENIEYRNMANRMMTENYVLATKDNSKVLEIVHDRINSRGDNSGVRELETNGINGSQLDVSDIDQLFDQKKGKITLGYSTSIAYPTLNKNGHSYILDYDVLGVPKEIKDKAQTVRTLSREALERQLSPSEIRTISRLNSEIRRTLDPYFTDLAKI